VAISGFTLVRNATLLDFPLEASIHSLLPVVDELVINVGESDDNTLDRVQAIADNRIRIVQSQWDRSRGPAMLADETDRAMAACRYPWGIYIQADEVFGDGSADLVRAAIEACDLRRDVDGILVDYRHFYGGFETIARNRKWYRREVRAVRLDAASQVHSYRDAQGFRSGAAQRHIRAIDSGAMMHHYGWARPAWALHAKRVEDGSRQPVPGDDQPLLPWIPGIEPFTGSHPAAADAWIAERNNGQSLISPRRHDPGQLRLQAALLLERLTGWRPFEFRNYEEVSARPLARRR
jgi:hypothetical protein